MSREALLRLGQDGQLWYSASVDLQRRWVGEPNALLEQTRRYYGRALSPETIENVIRMADMGFMRDLTDLTYEATRIDPHWSMCDRKRLRAVKAAKVRVTPATGNGINGDLAQKIADAVDQQIRWIPNLGQVLMRLNYGHKNGRAAAEKIWRENPSGDVKWRIDRINWIQPRRLSFGPERELRVRDDLSCGTGFEARGLDLRQYPYKFLSFLPQQFDENPEREGYGPRGLYFSFFKRFGKREELILLEVFGRPWRHIEEADPNRPVQGESLKSAAEEVDKMSANATGYAPPGTRIVTEQPGQGAGQVHLQNRVDCNDELSKLILGEVRTSDAKPGAIGSQGEDIAKEVSDETKNEDALALSDLFTEQFAADVVALNYGAEALAYCPRVDIAYEAPPDRGQEIERMTKVWSLGLPFVEDEVYEKVGMKKPGPEDATIKQAPQPAGPFGNPSADPGSTESVPGGGGSGSPLGDGGVGTKGQEDQASMTAPAPPDFLTLARAAHVLELTRYLGTPARVIRTVPKPKAKEPSEE